MERAGRSAIALVAVAGALAAAIDAGAQCAQSTTLTAVADSSVRRGQPNTPAGGDAVLLVREGDANRALVRFDLASLTGVVASAILEVTVAGSASAWGPTGRLLGVHRVTQPWSEAGVTWNCASDLAPANSRTDCSGASAWTMSGGKAPPYVVQPTAALAIENGDSGVLRFDVTADVAAQVAGAFPHDGWILLKETIGSGRVDLASRESATPPRLVVAGGGADRDGDGVCDDADNCPATANPDQDDCDDDGEGDACECDGVACSGPPVAQCQLAPACDSCTGSCVSTAEPDGTRCRLGEIAGFCLTGACVPPPSSCIAGRLLVGSASPALPAPPGTPVFVYAGVPAPSCAAGADDPFGWGTLVGDTAVADGGEFCVEYARRPVTSDPLPEIVRRLVAGDCALLAGFGGCAPSSLAVSERIDDPERLCDFANCIDVGDVMASCPN